MDKQELIERIRAIINNASDRDGVALDAIATAWIEEIERQRQLAVVDNLESLASRWHTLAEHNLYALATGIRVALAKTKETN